jgi:ATP-dependent DNA ligase
LLVEYEWGPHVSLIVSSPGPSGRGAYAIRALRRGRQRRGTNCRYRQHDGDVFLYAFDLIELNGDDLRRDSLQVRKATLASIVAKARPGIRFNEHVEGDGPTVFAHACKMGLEGIVSKRKDSMYRSGRSPDWLKMKNPEASAVKREAEEDWGRKAGG